MPFTVAHAAVVIPGARWLERRGLLAAAIIGSMAPDFGYFLPLRLERWQTHSFPALLSFCLPVGLFTWLLFELLIKPAMIEILPDRWYRPVVQKHDQPLPETARAWLWVVAALLAGAVTHLVWDGFTHESGRGVRLMPELDAPVHFAGREWYLYRLLQHGSSVVGFVLVLMAVAYWMVRTPAPDAPLSRRLSHRERVVWMCVYLLLPMLAATAVITRVIVYGDFGLLSSADGLADTAVIGMVAMAASLFVVSALLRLRLSVRLAPQQ
jgi:Domain of unknown function (DUF4184)